MSQIMSDLWYIDRMGSNRTIYPMNYPIYNAISNTYISNDTGPTGPTGNTSYISNNNIITNFNNIDIDIGIIYNDIPFIRTPIEITLNDNLHITREQQDCCICMMEQIEKVNICKLNCNHTFCGLCVCNILSKQDQTYNCPLCREEITKITVQTQENKNKLSEL